MRWLVIERWGGMSGLRYPEKRSSYRWRWQARFHWLSYVAMAGAYFRAGIIPLGCEIVDLRARPEGAA